MARGNKFERYLNDKDTSSSRSFLNKTIETTGKVLTTAALLGGGYYGLKTLKNNRVVRNLAEEATEGTRLSSAVKKVSQKIDYFDAYNTALSQTVKDSGYIRLLSGRAEKDFKSNLVTEFTRVGRGETRKLRGTNSFFEEALLNMNEDRAKIGESILYSVRKEKVLEEIKKAVPEGKDGEFLSKVLRNVVEKESTNKKFMDYTRKSDNGFENVREILEKHKVDRSLSDKGMREAEALMVDILESHSLKNNKTKTKFIKSNKDEIRRRVKSAKQEYEKALIKHSKKSGLASKFLEKMGLKKITVGDALRDDLFRSSIEINKTHFYKKLKDGTSKKITKGIDPQDILRNISDSSPDLLNAVVDPMIFKTGSGQVLDLRAFTSVPKKAVKSFGERFQVPFVNIKPFDMVGNLLGLGKQDRKHFGIFNPGTVMPTIPGRKNEMDPLKKSYMFFYGSVVDDTGTLIKENQYLVNSTKGPFARVHRAQAEATFNPKMDETPTSIFGKIKKWSGIGYQDHPSALANKLTAVTKFWDKEWVKNVYDDLKMGTSYADLADKNLTDAFKQFKAVTEKRIKRLDRDTLEIIAPHLKGTLKDETLENLITGNRKESVLQALDELSQRYRNNERITQDLMYKDEIEMLLNTFMKDPQSMDETYRYVRSSREAAVPEILESITSSRAEPETMLDHAEKVLHAELINQTELNTRLAGDTFSIGDLTKELIEAGASNTQVEDVRNLNLHRKLKSIENNGYRKGFLNDTAQGKFLDFIRNPGDDLPIRDDLERVIKQTNPWYGLGPGQRFENPFEGNNYIVMGESHPIERINQIIKDGGGIYDILKAGTNALGVGKDRIGRGRMSDTTTFSSAAYYYLFRLNEGISKAGLGLSYKDMGSTQDIFKNLMIKRILAPVAAVSAISYINDELGNLTGERPTEGLSRAYANTTVGVQTIKEITGLNTFGRYLKRQFPGIDKLEENPLGIAAKTFTFGMIGEDRSPIEMRDYYSHGVDPVRRGRFWAIGSSTPIYGDRIKYFQPNLYRRIQADPMMTDVMYGSTAEYWSNHWLPNPRNPLGALNPFTWGHWERKHYEDRPYPTTKSGLNEVPLIGPALDATLGRVVKPFRRRPGLERAHREYLEEINEKYKEYTSSNTQGGYMYMTPGGRLTNVNIAGGGLEGAQASSPGYSNLSGPAPIGTSTAGTGSIRASAPSQDGQVRVVDPTGGFAPMQSGSYISQSEITAANQGYVDKAYIKTNTNSMSIDSLRDNVFVENLDEAVDPNSPAFRLGETYYSATEMGGIYGFATTLAFGEGNPKGTILESADKMTSFNRKFWDLDLGGFPGEISEIYRRFIPRHRRAREYNPFENKMPDWLPGVEYFTDFKHGDPFCLSKDTLVDTEKGYIRAEDVNAGDVILTHKGRRLPVKQTIKRPILTNEKSYSIEISGIDTNIPLEFSEEHPILVKRLYRCSHASSAICRPDVRNYSGFCESQNCTNKWDKNKPEFIKVKDIEVGDAVAYPIPKTIEEINLINYSYKWADAPRSPYYEVEGSLELSKEIAWMLGMYIAEGSTAKSKGRPQRLIFSLHSDEVEVVERISKILETTFNKKPVIVKRGNSTEVILIDSRAARIINSIVPGNLYEKRVPKTIFLASKEIRLSFLLGFMLGDGTVQRNYIIGTSANKELILDLHRLSFELGIPARYEERKTREAYRLSIHTFHLKDLNLSDLMYKEEKVNLEFSRQPGLMSWSDGEYIYSIIKSKEEINLTHVYGFEVDEDDTFCVMGFATHNTKITKGEMRLPGEGYESLNKLHPDFYGEYGAIDRFKILADVAPYSDQYRYYSSVVSRMHNAGMINDQDYKQVTAVRDLVRQQKEKYDFHSYKFKFAEVDKKEVTVLRWIDKDTFLTKEYPGNPIRLAGIKMPSKDDDSSIAQKARAELEKTVKPGEKITIGIDADPLFQVRDDTMETMRAVVYDKWGESVNGTIARLSPFLGGVRGEESPVTTDWDDSSATTTHALYSPKQITLGKLWEKFAHMDTPFHTKILQIRSPLEMYKREEVYGKGWQSWRNPIRDWVVPTAEKIFERNPLNAALHGATAGFLMGAFAGSKGPAAVVGALVGGLGASVRTVGELTKRSISLDKGATWIPKRRQEQRNIDEYFDKIKYIKYKGLYERARQLAISREGVDPQDIIERSEARSGSTSYLRSALDSAKKWLKINKGSPFTDEEEIQAKLNAVNEESNYLDENRELIPAGPLTMKALEYREKYKTTLYGADPQGDLMRIYRALPKKDRPFFKEFMLAPAEEREEILRLVPKNQRRFYQAKWGLPVDRKESLSEFFTTHSLPGPDWKGWKPDYNVEEIKLKFVQNQGLEIGEFGYWEDDLRYVKNAPEVRKINSGSLINLADLRAALKGRGIDQADIEIQTEMVAEDPGNRIGIDIMMNHDRRQEVNDTINENIFDILG